VKIIVIAIIVLIVIAIAGSMILQLGMKQTLTTTITNKERVVKDKDSYYLVWTDKEVFSLKDSFWNFQFRSSDLYGKLQPGKTYEVVVYGLRIPFFSWYRNIISVKEVLE